MVSATNVHHADSWIRETRIGTWLIGSNMWRNYVLPETMADLEILLGDETTLGRVLDIGCGNGFTFPLIDECYHPEYLLGIDIDPDLVQRAESLASRCACRTDIRVGDAANIDLPDQSMDTVFCHQCFHHLASQEAAAREFFRVLVPGGRLIFMESCRSFIFSWWVRMFFRHPMEVQKSAEEYIALLEATGFEIHPDEIVRPFPFWARPDIGLFEVLGRPVPEQHNTPLICALARRPR